MHRTQPYLDDQLWDALRAHARSTGTSISELVRVAVRAHYLGNLEKRRNAMLALVGLRKDRPKFQNVDEYVRDLGRDTRIDRIS
ncbi:MAG TPA: CopG family transcriptional regulator [Bryobacteraceae bacterium]|nr:CopG family transcriptional regulator [Bryobacteraceae bacterium]